MVTSSLATSRAPGRLLVVEDEYLIADEMRRDLEALGASVIGPVPNVAAAMSLFDSDPDIDGAILDINLAGETVFPVAAALEARRIPFVFWTAYESWTLPSEFRDRPRLAKPSSAEEALRYLRPMPVIETVQPPVRRRSTPVLADVFVSAHGDYLLRLHAGGLPNETELDWIGLASIDPAQWSVRLRMSVEPGVFYRVPPRYLQGLWSELAVIG
ncbi:response regulator [Lysobacter sp. HA18]